MNPNGTFIDPGRSPSLGIRLVVFVVALAVGLGGSLVSGPAAHAATTRILGTPAAVARTQVNLDVFVRTDAKRLAVKSWDQNVGWKPWEDLGCCIVSDPAAASLGTDGLYVVGRGENNYLYSQVWRAGRGWSGWIPIANSPQFQGNPSVAGYFANGAFIAARDVSGNIWTAIVNADTGYGSWQKVGAGATTDPSVAFAPNAWGPMVTYRSGTTIWLTQPYNTSSRTVTTLRGSLQPRLVVAGGGVDLVFDDEVNGQTGLKVSHYTPTGAGWSPLTSRPTSVAWLDNGYRCTGVAPWDWERQEPTGFTALAPDGVMPQLFFRGADGMIVTRPNAYGAEDANEGYCAAKFGRITSSPVAVARLSTWIDSFGVGYDGQLYTMAGPSNHDEVVFNVFGWADPAIQGPRPMMNAGWFGLGAP